MHVEIVHIFLGGELVLFSRKPNEPLVIDIDPEGVAASNESIDPEIELESLVEEGVGHVLLDDAVLMFEDFCLLY